jgi:hypothetical protein
MWFYIQSTGEVYWQHPPVTELVATGYAGAGALKNDPASQCVSDLGPIPRGDYTIGEIGDYGPNQELKWALPLTPAPENDMCDRSNFLIHGDSSAHPGWGSAGCIVIADRTVRLKIAQSGDNNLRVIRENIV